MRARSRPCAIAWLAPSLVGALALSSCGKKGPPLPPLKTVPEAASALRARQIGDRIILTLEPPAKLTDGTLLSPSASLDIHVTLKSPPPDSPRTVLSQPAATWSIPAHQWDRYRRADRLEIPLPLERIAAALPAESVTLLGKPLSFVAEVVEGQGHSAPTPVTTIAACAAPPPPSGQSARIVPDGVLITWGGGSDQPGRVNVYRRDAGAPLPLDPAGEAGASETSYHDGRVPENKPVEYVLRRGTAAGCESIDGDVLAVTWIDIFPPAQPQGLAAVEEEGTIRLFWRPNQESDLRGYRVYRSALRNEGDAPEWMMLTPDAIVTTSFTDAQPAPGVTYIYAVTAVDDAEPVNESPYSEPAGAILEAEP